MTAVVACGLATSSCASNLWVEWHRVPVGLSISSLGCLGSESQAFCCSTQFLVCIVPTVSLMPDSGHLSWVLAAVACGLASSSGISSFRLSGIEYRLVCLSPPWVVLVWSLRLSAVRLSSLSALSLQCRWLLTVDIYPGWLPQLHVLWLHHPARVLLGWAA